MGCYTKFGNNTYDLLSGLTWFNPEIRFTAYEALHSDYFDDLSEDYIDIYPKVQPTVCINNIRCLLDSTDPPTPSYEITSPKFWSEKLRAEVVAQIFKITVQSNVKSRGTVPQQLIIFHYAVSILDRYMSMVDDPPQTDELDLLGETCAAIATNLISRYYTQPMDVYYELDKKYTLSHISDFYLDVLNILDYNLNIPSLYTFIDQYVGEITNKDVRSSEKAILRIIANYVATILQFTHIVTTTRFDLLAYVICNLVGLGITNCVIFDTRRNIYDLASIKEVTDSIKTQIDLLAKFKDVDLPNVLDDVILADVLEFIN
jgi:hypothetical protein